MPDKNYAGNSGLSAVFGAIKSALNNKVDKEAGKGLSTNDYTNEEKAALAGKQDELTFDNIPTENSTNPVKSGGVYAVDEAIRKWTTAEAKSVSGNPITLTDGSARNAEGLVVECNPKQNLHGYDHPWVGGAGKNKLAPFTGSTKEGTTLNVNSDGSAYFSGSDSSARAFDFERQLKAGTYILSGVPNGSSQGNYDMFVSYGGSVIARSYSGSNLTQFTLESDSTVTVGIRGTSGTLDTNKKFYPMIRLASVSDATFAPYSNECPITGYTECVVDRDSRNLYAGGNQSFTGIKEVNVSLKAGTYTISATTTTTATNRPTIVFFNGTTDIGRVYLPTGTRTSATITLPQDVTSVKFQAGETLATASSKDATFTDVQIEYGDTATAYVPYSHAQATITFGQTVYGGSVDFKTGKVTVTHKLIDLGALTWTRIGTKTADVYRMYATLSEDLAKTIDISTVPNAICEIYNALTASATYNLNTGFFISNDQVVIYDPDYNTYDSPAAFKTAMDGVHLCYELATPIVLTLTPAELQLLKGYNYITTNGTTIALAYLPDSLLAEAEAYVDAKIPPAPSSDGAYVLTCTVTDGTPAYTWESAT